MRLREKGERVSSLAPVVEGENGAVESDDAEPAAETAAEPAVEIEATEA
jgi:hypothetical protein